MSGYVIAGATGHVGSVVANELLAEDQKIKVIVRDAKQGSRWSGRGAEVAVGTLDDARFLAGALQGAEGFLALLPESPAAEDMHAVRRRMADAIATAVKESGVPQVVMLSSLGADLAERNGPIGDLHYLERALRAAGTRLRAIRSSYYQENLANVIPAAEHAGIYPNFLPSADAPFPTVATRDVGRLAAKLLGSRPHATEVVDLLGPIYTVHQLAAALGIAIGKPLNVVAIPPEGQVAALMEVGVSRSVAEAYAEMFAGLGAGIIAPKGDRKVLANTTIEEVLRGLLAPRPA